MANGEQKFVNGMDKLSVVKVSAIQTTRISTPTPYTDLLSKRKDKLHLTVDRLMLENLDCPDP